MEAYKRDLDNFEKTIKLKQLEKALNSVRSTHSHSSCKVIIKLVGEWENKTLATLKDFLVHYFKKDSLFNLSRVEGGCLSVTFLVPLSIFQYLIDTATPQLKSMSRVGVLQLMINDVELLDEKDDIDLNESLVEAVKLDGVFEVSLLLSLGADPYYKDSNGDSPIMLVKSKKVVQLFVTYVKLEAFDADDETSIYMNLNEGKSQHDSSLKEEQMKFEAQKLPATEKASKMRDHFSRSIPEYEVLHEYLHRICDALSKLPDSITPLARDLCSSDIIPSVTMSSASNMAQDPYDRANAIMTAAHLSVQQDPKKFDAVLEKLSDQGLRSLAKKMNKRLEVQVLGARPRSPTLLSKYNITSSKIKQKLNILVVGHNGSGKSSLINEILGQDIAIVGGSAQETTQDVVVKHRCKVGEVDVTIFDTRGFGDTSMTDKGTMNTIINGIESIDIVLICHRLYDRVDGTAKKEMEVLLENMDDNLIDLSIFVFTFGDDYLSRCDPEFESKQEIKKAMEAQQCEIESLFKDAMKKNSIGKKYTDHIPSCITCGKRKKNGEQKELPTSDNWVDDLWELFEKRCKSGARPFVRSVKSILFRGIRTLFDKK